MTEAQLQTKITRFMKTGGGRTLLRSVGASALAYEVKCVRGDSVPYSAIPDHQWLELERAAGRRKRGCAHKISDSGIGYKPFDGFYLDGCWSVFVFGYFGGKEVWIVDAERVSLVLSQRERGRGSFNVEWVRENGEIKLEM